MDRDEIWNHLLNIRKGKIDTIEEEIKKEIELLPNRYKTIAEDYYINAYPVKYILKIYNISYQLFRFKVSEIVSIIDVIMYKRAN